ncbi:hypothetical protein [Streptomonospora nanhaiensis]|uniref:hypothetical protein n=1 Tax=Streptomonospora nanhaiensis TaxID=1323731 RepID=UPI001C390C9A|nr:hypothetical protein [Streptomonospora nanhaiensis]MBV2366957.1 hypothetical protein [Streptomonospora nanhaiensis]
MGYQLYRHVLNHAPADLTKEERLLLLAIADDAHERTRVSSPGRGLLEHWTGMGDQAIKKALRKLAERGWEIRIPIAKRADGSPVYAVRGRRSTYRVPEFPPRPDHPLPVFRDPQSDEQSRSPETANETEWGSFENGMGVSGDPPSPQSPNTPPPAPRERTPSRAPGRRPRRTDKKDTRTPVEIVMDATGATETEAEAVIARLQDEHQIKSLTGFLRHTADNGDLAGALAAHRNLTRRRRTTQLCDDHTRPIDRCPFCAAQHQRDAS